MRDKCPRCGEKIEYDEVDIGVGTLRGNAGCQACHWTPALRKFVAVVEVTPELLQYADHSRFDIWEVAAPADAVRSTMSVEKLIIPSHGQRYPDSITVHVLGWAERAEQEDGDFGIIWVDCPQCGAAHEDHDGFGVLYCSACGYCTHATRNGDVCAFCGKRVKTCERCQGHGSIQGMEAGFGGVDQGAECGDCEGSGIITEEVVS